MSTKHISGRRTRQLAITALFAIGLSPATAGCTFSLEMAPRGPKGAEASVAIGPTAEASPTADVATATDASATTDVPPTSDAAPTKPANAAGSPRAAQPAPGLVEASATGLGLDGSLVLLRR
jgi:hypothetical protein